MEAISLFRPGPASFYHAEQNHVVGRLVSADIWFPLCRHSFRQHILYTVNGPTKFHFPVTKCKLLCNIEIFPNIQSTDFPLCQPRARTPQKSEQSQPPARVNANTQPESIGKKLGIFIITAVTTMTVLARSNQVQHHTVDHCLRFTTSCSFETKSMHSLPYSKAHPKDRILQHQARTSSA